MAEEEGKIEDSESPQKSTAEDTPAEVAEPTVPPIESFLPNKFLADDPNFIDRSVERSGTRKVLIPDGRGGMQSVDERIVKIEHKGEIIELIALPEHERQKRQRIINFVSIAIGVLFFVLFFWLCF